MTGGSIPVRHHYIPQFILRNFCCDKGRHLWYIAKDGAEPALRETRDVFMERNLYTDCINAPGDTVRTEKALAEFERETADIIRNRFLSEGEITLSSEENEALKFFLAIMGFRSAGTAASFGSSAAPERMTIYAPYQKDGNYVDLWKRNIGYLAGCRSVREALRHPDIDAPVKIFMQRDAFGYTGRHLSVVECRENEEFVISDAYPAVAYGWQHGPRKELYSVYPISPERAIIDFCEDAKRELPEVLVLRKSIFNRPETDGGRIRIAVRRLYPGDTDHINAMTACNARIGTAARSREILEKYAPGAGNK